MMRRIAFSLLVMSMLAPVACKKEAVPTEVPPAPAVEAEAPAPEAEAAKPAEAPAAEAPAPGDAPAGEGQAAAAQGGSQAPDPATYHPAMLDPSKATETAPAKYKVKFATTKGDFIVEVDRDWAPNGADRFYNLVKIGYFQDLAFFRVISGFMMQFGIHGDPSVNKVWREANIKDDAVKQSNKPGYLTFAQTGMPNSRSVQFFINFGDNAMLDSQRFAPIGKVADGGMPVVQSIYSGYGEGAPMGRGPDQMRTQEEGNKYLRQDFPQLDYIKSVTLVD